MIFQQHLTQTLKISHHRLPLPLGTYIWQIKENANFDVVEGSNGSSDVVDIDVECVAPTDSVDPEALAAFGEFEGLPQRLRFWFPKEDPRQFANAEFRLAEFLIKACGVEAKNLREACAKCKGAQFLGSVKWTRDKKDERIIYANIDKTFAQETVE